MADVVRVTGDLNAGPTPLVVAHGGPGCTHDYVWLWPNRRTRSPVVHYDQLGGGDRRTCREGRDFWTVELFLEELETCSFT